MDDPVYALGVPAAQLREAAALYNQAFGQKFGVAVRNHDKRLSLLRASLNPEFAICALLEGELVGLAGFHTEEGSLTSGMGLRDLLEQLGVLRGLWAAGIFSLYERKPEAGELLMDGIAVRADMRGRGVGGRLLDEVVRYAKKNRYTHVRLDVIDINDSARRLYARKGFRAVHTERFEFLRPLLGFGASTTMRLEIAARSPSTSAK